jgi:hypothetical protein
LTPNAKSAAARARRFASEHRWLLAIVAAGALVRFATLDQGIWSDENLAIQVITLAPAEILPRIQVAETNPPLYFIIATPWERIFGDGELALRSLPALLGTATIPAVYGAAAALASRRASLFAAAITAASPFLIWYSQEVRPYALFALLSALSFLCFAKLLRDGGPRWLWGWALASGLAIASHYFGVLLFAIEAIWLFFALRPRRVDVFLAAASVGAVGLVLLPLAVSQEALTGWIEMIPLEDRLAQVPQHLAIGASAPWDLLAPAVTIALGTLIAYALVVADPGTLRAAAIAGGTFLCGLGIVLVAVAAGSDLLNTRNLLGLWAPFAVAVGSLLAAPRLARAGLAAVGALCAIGLGLAVWTAYTPETSRPDWDEVAEAIGPAPEGRAVLTRSGFTAPLSLYMPGARNADPGEQVTTSEIDVISLLPADDYSVGPCWWVGACGGREILGEPEQSISIPEAFERVGAVRTQLYEIARYRADRPVALPPTGFTSVVVQPPS